MPEMEFTTPRRPGRQPMRLTCDQHVGAFTVPEAAALAGVGKDAIYFGLKRGHAVGAAKLKFRRQGENSVGIIPNPIPPAPEPRNLVCDKIPGEKFCASAAARTAGIDAEALMLAVERREPVGRDRMTFSRQDDVPPLEEPRQGKPAEIPIDLDAGHHVAPKAVPAGPRDELIAGRVRADLAAARAELASLDERRSHLLWRVEYMAGLLDGVL